MPKLGVPLSVEQKRDIAAWFEKLGNPTPAQIARRIGRHVGTVKWHMLNNGMYNRKPRQGPARYFQTRNGVTVEVNPYTPEHDAFIQAQRAAGLSCAKVAAAVTARFGIERKGHSVRVRLVLLAAAPESEAA